MKETVRLNFEFPKKAYPYLKLLCAEKGVSLREFATQTLIEAMEEYEDQLLTKEAKRRFKEMKKDQNISFDKATKLAGWKDDD